MRVNRWLHGVVVMACGLSWLVAAGMAQQASEKTFSSPQHASNALYLAAMSGDEAQLLALLGGSKELVSPENSLSDKQEQETFTKKYQEMHRLRRGSDGAMILFVGAENWPFPVPIVAKKGRWYFEADKGAKEIIYRRVGANEITAIETCHALATDGKTNASEFHMPEDQALLQYAHEVASGQGSVDQPFDGYYFRKFGSGSGAVYLAYPAEWRSSGVMTFVVTNDDKVYEKNLGPETALMGKEMKDWKMDKSWSPAEE